MASFPKNIDEIFYRIKISLVMDELFVILYDLLK